MIEAVREGAGAPMSRERRRPGCSAGHPTLLTQTMAEASRLYRSFLREVGKSVSIWFIKSFLGWIR